MTHLKNKVKGKRKKDNIFVPISYKFCVAGQREKSIIVVLGVSAGSQTRTLPRKVS